MKTTFILHALGAASCLTLASCSSLWPYSDSDTSERRGSGYSLDKPSRGEGRYMAGTKPATPPETPADPAVAGTTPPVEGTTPPPTDTPPPVAGTTPPPPVPPVPGVPPTSPTPSAPAAPPVAAAPTYGTPVPGRRGFVYPPGVDAKPENMVDVRDFTPGQKVRDPRTGKIFLVP